MTSLTERSTRTGELMALGQSVWLDYIRRGILDSGELARMVHDGWISGVTSNPTIFEKAVSGSHDYDKALRALAHQGRLQPYEAFVAIAVEDIARACDALRPVYDTTAGVDGYVSLEIPPGIEVDTGDTVEEALRLNGLVARPNVMIKVPGTTEGIRALEELIFEGVNVNQTLLFAVEAYEQVAEAYVRGLERRSEAGRPLAAVASVASFFVSRVDIAVDALLPEGSPLRGRIAVANAHLAYKRFQAIFSGPRWERLAAAGARVQRPLWASTGTKNPAYSDILYVEDLVAPHTVNTMPEATLQAVLDHLVIRPAIAEGMAQSEADLAALTAAGIDLRAVTDRLLADGLASFQKDFDRLLERLDATLALERAGRPGAAPAPLTAAVDARLARMAKENVVARIWAGDHTVWRPDPAEISDRLGWLRLADEMAGHLAGLDAFAAEAAQEGFTTALLLGMGGSSLAPEVLRATFGVAPGRLDLAVLDTTDPTQIAATERSLDLAKTLFIVASKSGGTIETRSHFSYFWEKVRSGRQFVAITDPGTSLEQLATEHAFRRVFPNQPDVGGRYSALSFFGMVPAALLGIDLERLLDGARDMAKACSAMVEPAANPGAWLGAVMGEAALAGRDKVTLALPHAIETAGYWIEQLIAESTGKEGKGIVPVEGEPLGRPEVYENDRLFVALGDDPALADIEAAGHPVVRLPYRDAYQLGAEFVRWEFATAGAGHVLAINPFDQPNVQEAKDATARILAGEVTDATTPAIAEVLGQVRPGDYIAICAYLPRSAHTMEQLATVRRALRDRYRVATTVGFGPRFLHSTGQLHKGGANNGVFLQVVDHETADLAIPGQAYTFGQMKAAQALGDLASLRAHGRRVARTTLGALIAAVEEAR